MSHIKKSDLEAASHSRAAADCTRTRLHVLRCIASGGASRLRRQVVDLSILDYQVVVDTNVDGIVSNAYDNYQRLAVPLEGLQELLEQRGRYSRELVRHGFRLRSIPSNQVPLTLSK